MKKILVVGYGSIGKRHVKNLLSYFDVKVIIYTKQKNLKLIDKKRVKIFNNLKQCLEENPDIGFITNETSYHVSTAIKLAKKGMDLFLEKPLSNSMKDVNKLQNYINKKKLITQIGCNLRFYPSIQYIKKLISDNVLGKIISVQVENGSYLPDWHPHEDYRYGYAAKKDLGGGVLLTQIHEIDYLYWFFGDVAEVLSVTGKYSNLKVSADDLSTSILRFKNNIIVELHLDFFQRPFFKRCKIRGNKGTIYWNSENNKIKLYDMKKRRWIEKKIEKNYKLTSKIKANQMYVDEVKHFLDCVDKRKSTTNDIKQGIKTLEIALAIKKSSKLQKIIKV